MPGSQTRAVFFDAAGTLFRLRENVGQGYATMARLLDALDTGGPLSTTTRNDYFENCQPLRT